jgi:hypothetical protein
MAQQQPQQRGALGRAVQVDPIKPTLKATGTERLKLKYEELLSNVGFKFNLRRYNWDTCRWRHPLARRRSSSSNRAAHRYTRRRKLAPRSSISSSSSFSVRSCVRSTLPSWRLAPQSSPTVVAVEARHTRGRVPLTHWGQGVSLVRNSRTRQGLDITNTLVPCFCLIKWSV